MPNSQKQTLIQILFVDLKNKPFKNLYHEVRKSGEQYALSAGNSDAQGLGVWIKQPVGTHLDIVVRHPISKKMIPAHQYIIVPDKKGKIRIQAPFYIEEKNKLQPRQGEQGDYLRKPHIVKKGETLTSIAKQYGTDWQILFNLNRDKIKDPDEIRVGDVIKVPPKNKAASPTSSTSGTSHSPSKGQQAQSGTHATSSAGASTTSSKTPTPSNQTPNPVPQSQPRPQPAPQHTQAVDKTPSTTASSGGILDKAGELWDSTKESIESGVEWVDKTTQPVQDAVVNKVGEMKEGIENAVSSHGTSTPSTQPPVVTPTAQPAPQATKSPVKQHNPVTTTNTQQRGQTETPKIVSTTTGSCVCQTYKLIWGTHKNVTCEFRKKVVEISKDLWPDHYLEMANKLMAVFAWESGGTFKADAPNQSNSGGTGLIQIMPKTYRSLTKNKPIMENVVNYWGNRKTLKRVKQLADMTEIQQLDLVKKYFEPLRGKRPEFIDFYLQVLFPASSGLPEHVVFAKYDYLLDRPNESKDLKDKRVGAFAKNNMDTNGDNRVMKSEIAQKVEHYLTDGKKYQEIRSCTQNPATPALAPRPTPTPTASPRPTPSPAPVPNPNPPIFKPVAKTNCVVGNQNCICQGLNVQNGIVKNHEVIQDLVNMHQSNMEKSTVKAILLHRTAGYSAQSSIKSGRTNKAVAHFYVDNNHGKDGQIFQALSINGHANHMGVAQNKKTKLAKIGNFNTVSIEVAGMAYDKNGKTIYDKGAGKFDHWESLTDKQAKSVACLLVALMKYFNLSYDKVLFHEDMCSKSPYEGRLVWISIKKYLPSPPTGVKPAPYRDIDLVQDPRYPEN